MSKRKLIYKWDNKINQLAIKFDGQTALFDLMNCDTQINNITDVLFNAIDLYNQDSKPVKEPKPENIKIEYLLKIISLQNEMIKHQQEFNCKMIKDL